MKSAKEPFAASVTGEHAACPVRSVCRGRKAHDEKPRLGVAKIGNGPPEIGVLTEGSALNGRYVEAVFSEAWASFASDDPPIESRPWKRAQRYTSRLHETRPVRLFSSRILQHGY
jgi:hypothetical protein